MRRRQLAFALVGAFAWARSAEAAPKRRVVDRVVAIVDDACITKSELERFVVPMDLAAKPQYEGRPGELAAALATIRKEGLDSLIDRKVFAKEAARLHLEVLPSDLQAALTQIAAQNHVSVAQTFVLAKENGLDEERYRAELSSQILEGRLVWLDAPKRYADWKVLSEAARAERFQQARTALVAELRAKSYIEVRL
jgi:peptidyl-prolyl cis-trans isomerase SurA